MQVPYRTRQYSLSRAAPGESDHLAVAQCFERAQYDMPSGAHGVLAERLDRDILKSGRKPLIVDCNANIGASVLWFAARYPEAHFIAVESIPDNFLLLPKNTLGLDVDLRQAGIGSVDGFASLSNPGGCSMPCRTNHGQNGIAIYILSFTPLRASKPAAENTSFLLKVDIKGAKKSSSAVIPPP